MMEAGSAVELENATIQHKEGPLGFKEPRQDECTRKVFVNEQIMCEVFDAEDMDEITMCEIELVDYKDEEMIECERESVKNVEAIDNNNIQSFLKNIEDVPIPYHTETIASEDQTDVSHTVTTATPVKNHKCHPCGKRVSHTSHVTQPKVVHPRKYKVIYICEVCGKQINLKKQLSTHSMFHLGFKMYECELCDSQFKKSAFLKKHLLVHTNIKDFKCEVCQKEFARKWELKQHYVVHYGVKNYQCDKCGIQFRCKRNLECHVRIHTERKTYKCDLCNKLYNRKHSLKKHTKKHHPVLLKTLFSKR